MKVLYCPLGRAPHTIEIPNKLEIFQDLVGGNIEVLQLDHEFVLVADEEGLLKKKPVNKIVTTGEDFMTVIVGPFFVCRVSGEDFKGIAVEDVEKIKGYLYEPYR